MARGLEQACHLERHGTTEREPRQDERTGRVPAPQLLDVDRREALDPTEHVEDAGVHELERVERLLGR